MDLKAKNKKTLTTLLVLCPVTLLMIMKVCDESIKPDGFLFILACMYIAFYMTAVVFSYMKYRKLKQLEEK